MKGTVIRESVIENRCEDILESICLSNKRYESFTNTLHLNCLDLVSVILFREAASLACPGIGLAL